MHDRKVVPTWTRPWQSRWVVKGLPGGLTFWREIDGQALVVGLGAFVLSLFLRQYGLAPRSLLSMAIVHLGLPGLLGWAVTKARFQGKRLDRWLSAYLAYRYGPKRTDRGRPVAGPAIYRFDGGVTRAQADRDPRHPASR